MQITKYLFSMGSLYYSAFAICDKIAPKFVNVSEYRLITIGVQNPKPRKTICKAQWLTNGAPITPLGNRDEPTKLAYVNTAYATKTQHVLLSLRDVVPFIVYDIKNGSRDFLVYFSVSLSHHQMETFPRYWPSVRGIHRSPGNSLHKGQWRGALILSFICACIKRWVNNREAGDLRRHRSHYDVTVMGRGCWSEWSDCIYC